MNFNTEDAAREINSLNETKTRYEACFVRIATAYGITTPLILVGMAKNNEENYAEILTRFVEEQQAKQTAKLAVPCASPSAGRLEEE